MNPPFTQPILIIVSHTQVFLSFNISFINNITRKHQIIYAYISCQESKATIKKGGPILTQEPRDKRHLNCDHVIRYGCGDVRKFLLHGTSGSIVFI